MAEANLNYTVDQINERLDLMGTHPGDPEAHRELFNEVHAAARLTSTVYHEEEDSTKTVYHIVVPGITDYNQLHDVVLNIQHSSQPTEDGGTYCSIKVNELDPVRIWFTVRRAGNEANTFAITPEYFWPGSVFRVIYSATNRKFLVLDKSGMLSAPGGFGNLNILGENYTTTDDMSPYTGLNLTGASAMYTDLREQIGTLGDQYAPALIGSATGNSVALSDVTPLPSTFKSLTVSGNTVQDGIPSPNAPVNISGADIESVTVAGKNILDRSSPLKGGYNTGYAYTSQSTAALPYTGSIQSNGVCYVVSCRAGTTYTLSISNAHAYAAIRMAEYPSLAEAANIANRLGTATGSTDIVNGAGTLNPYTAVSDGILVCNISSKHDNANPSNIATITGDELFQLEVNSTATEYAPFNSRAYTLPVLAPLYGKGGAFDSYDAVTGTETRVFRRLALPPDYAHLRRDTDGGLLGVQTARFVFSEIIRQSPSMAGSAPKSACTHLPVENIYNLDKPGIFDNGLHIYLRVPVELADTVEQLRVWLTAQAAAGTPVELVYPLAKPVVTQHEGQAIKACTPDCTVTSNAGATALEYRQDTNKAIMQLKAAILTMGGTM